MPTGREIASFYRMLQEAIDEAQGELTPQMEEDLKSYEDSMDAKVEAIDAMIKDAEMWRQRFKSEKDSFAVREKQKDNEINRLKYVLKTMLEESGLPKAG